MMTRSEFFQALLNLVDDKLYVRHSASRKEIKSWLASLSKTSYAYQTLTTKDIQTIQNIPLSTTKVSQSVTLQSLDEFNAYLKYCMFNLQSCGFQEL
ncbi:hypothetical protein J5893_03050 [bacterium]|nr:hypothetical protein [bacterium]